MVAVTTSAKDNSNLKPRYITRVDNDGQLTRREITLEDYLEGREATPDNLEIASYLLDHRASIGTWPATYD